MNNNCFKSKGFTLVEVILGMAMVAMTAAMTIPHYVNASQAAHAQSKWDIAVAAKDNHSMIVDTRGSAPTVVALADSLSALQVKAVPGGLLVQVDGDAYTVPTYGNTLCNEPTRNVNDTIGCVGSIQ